MGPGAGGFSISMSANPRRHPEGGSTWSPASLPGPAEHSSASRRLLRNTPFDPSNECRAIGPQQPENPFRMFSRCQCRITPASRFDRVVCFGQSQAPVRWREDTRTTSQRSRRIEQVTKIVFLNAFAINSGILADRSHVISFDTLAPLTRVSTNNPIEQNRPNKTWRPID